LENTQANTENTHIDPAPADDSRRKLSIWTIVAAFAVLVGFLGLVAWGLNRAQSGPVKVDAVAPGFSLVSFDGQTYDTKALAGKVIVVNFWASWCVPCKQEAADLEEAWQSYKDDGKVLFVGVNYVDTEPKATAYLKEFNITYPNGPDLGTRISHDYRITGVPETYIIGTDGKIKYAKTGPFSSTAEIKAAIDPFVP
jgi:cytochrome c biogenesis protein CcmG/thiol:disulfide interchange protein DsbE